MVVDSMWGNKPLGFAVDIPKITQSSGVRFAAELVQWKDPFDIRDAAGVKTAVSSRFRIVSSENNNRMVGHQQHL